MLARSLSALLATSAAKAATLAIIIELMPVDPLGVLPGPIRRVALVVLGPSMRG